MDISIRDIIISWYETHEEDYYESGDSLRSRCVVHDGSRKDSLRVDLITGHATCYSKGCKFNPLKFFGINKTISRDDVDTIRAKITKSLGISEEFYRLNILNEAYLDFYSKPHGKWLDYLYNRGITDEAIEYFEIMCCDDPEQMDYNSIVFPIRNKNADIVNFSIRNVDNQKGGFMKYNMYERPKFNIFLNLHNIKSNKPVFITEGAFDVISLWIMGIKNVIGALSVHLNPYQMGELINYPFLVFANDNPSMDEAGSNATVRAMSSLAEKSEKMFGWLVQPDGFKDWNDVLVDINAKECMKEKLENLKFLSSKEVLK